MLCRCICLALALSLAVGAQTAQEEDWIQLFNGENLDGWIPKIRGHDAGVNFGNTFRVVDGAMQTGYEAYDGFNARFGHIFYKDPYSYYLLRLEYRFVGEQAEGGPGWAVRNSGIMMHSPPPESMPKDQTFPISIEVQLLGGTGEGEPEPLRARNTSRPRYVEASFAARAPARAEHLHRGSQAHP